MTPIKSPNALLHGTLDALILKTLGGGPRHGYGIARFIEDASGDSLLIEEGSLYPALYRDMKTPPRSWEWDRQVEQQVDDELGFHLEMQQEARWWARKEREAMYARRTFLAVAASALLSLELGAQTSGQLRFGVDHGPEQIIETGDTFFEPAGAVHSTFGSASDTTRARVLAFMVVPTGTSGTAPA